MPLWQCLIQRSKWVIAVVLQACGFLAWLRRWRARRGEIPVLALHRVGGSPESRQPQAIPPQVLRQMIQALSQRYTICSWETCVRVARSRDPHPHIAITFDDGYLDNAEWAWPILREAGATGIFCVTTRFVDGVEPHWWDVIAAAYRPTQGPRFRLNRFGQATYGAIAEGKIHRLKTLPSEQLRQNVASLQVAAARDLTIERLPVAMSWAEARRMVEEGADFGGHGLTHAILTNCSDDELASELKDCRETLCRELGREITIFAYPNGDYDDRVVARTRHAGFRYAFSVERGYYTAAGDPLKIPRIMVSEPLYSLNGCNFSWPLFEAEVLGVFEVLLWRRLRRRA